MNREILFRGKRIENGEWVYGSLVLWYDGSISIETGVYDAPMYAVDPATIGQFTGLTDKNGKRIFEGDLITIPGSKRQGLPAPVTWSNFDARFEICRRGFNPICLDGDEGIYEVIGNIHDNYEFLEGE